MPKKNKVAELFCNRCHKQLAYRVVNQPIIIGSEKKLSYGEYYCENNCDCVVRAKV
jgi:hypothetical protein